MRGQAVCLFLFLLIPSLAVADFSGRVVRVLDGDTIEVLHNHHAERFRLNGIDCPEKGQAYGKRAKRAASEFVFGKQVTLQTYEKDKYGWTIADVLLPDGTNVNHTLVKDGWCWWYRKYAPLDTKLEMLRQSRKQRDVGCGPIRIRHRRGSGGRESKGDGGGTVVISSNR